MGSVIRSGTVLAAIVVGAAGCSQAAQPKSGAGVEVPGTSAAAAPTAAAAGSRTELARFTAVTDKVEAISTNGDLFLVAVAGGEAKKITANPAFDGNPVYSPDGRYIAYHAQLTPGYESDRWRVMLYDRATHKNENKNPTAANTRDAIVFLIPYAERRRECRRRLCFCHVRQRRPARCNAGMTMSIKLHTRNNARPCGRNRRRNRPRQC